MAETTGQEIRRLRQARGWTQVDLAVLAGVSPATIHRTESGRHAPSPDTASRIFTVLKDPNAKPGPALVSVQGTGPTTGG